MDCSEAQALLHAGAIPGGGPGRNAHLGFHLAGCAACRATRVNMPVLVSPIISAATTPMLPIQASPPRFSRARRFWLIMVIMVIALVIPGWYVGLPLARAWRNLGHMSSVAAGAGGMQSASNVQSTRIVEVVSATAMATETDEPTIAVAVASVVTQDATSDVPTPATFTAVPRMMPTQPLGAEVVDPPTPTATPLPTATEIPTAIPTATEMPTNTPVPPPTNTPVPPPTNTPVPPPTSTPVPPPTALPPSPTPAPAIEPVAPAVAAAPPPAQQNTTSAGGVTILVVGLDARPGETASRSDAILVLRVDPVRQTIALLSLPRDLWVVIPNYGEGKINSAYYLGQQTGKGSAVAAATVANALGIRIDYTAAVDFQGFSALIDALGGVPVDVPRELYDAKFPTIDYGYTVAHFTPGVERMNGARALMYSRIRHPDSDFQRMRRQQAVALAMARQFRERGALANMHEADKLTGALAPFVRTDMPRGEALRLMWDLRGFDFSTARRIVVDTAIVGEATIGGSYALVADDSVLRSVGAQLTAP